MTDPRTGPGAPVRLDGLTIGDLRDRPVVVLGLARSGIALARFLVDAGAHVTVYDAREAADLGEALSALGDRPLRRLLGPAVAPEEALTGQALVCTSPSISSRYPTTEPRLRAALGAVEAEGRVPVVSEVDLFLRLCPALTVGITGTKGKTTTSSLCAAVLGAGAAPVLLGGNIGIPLVERLPELTSAHRVVLELSELQLPTISRGTDVSVYTHVTSDHLDRHGTLAAYRAVKRRLAELAPASGALILNEEDPVSLAFADASAARVVRYSRGLPPRGGVGIAGGWIVADGVERLEAVGGGTAMAGPGGRILPLDSIPLPGEHSWSNVAAAVATGLVLGIAPDGIRRAVEAFPGVEHRLELVAVAGGIRYVNDSQGTQPDAVIAALEAFPAPVVLIAGGRDKGVAVDRLARVAAERAAAAILIGETGPALEAAFRSAGLARTERAGTMDDAVRRAATIAAELRAGAPEGAEPATVLLSPAAASFDMFADYAARGRAFRSAVAAHLRERAAGGAR